MALFLCISAYREVVIRNLLKMFSDKETEFVTFFVTFLTVLGKLPVYFGKQMSSVVFNCI